MILSVPEDWLAAVPLACPRKLQEFITLVAPRLSGEAVEKWPRSNLQPDLELGHEIHMLVENGQDQRALVFSVEMKYVMMLDARNP